MKLLETIKIGDENPKYIELYHGDLSNTPPE